MDRGAWWAAVHGARELDTAERLSTYKSLGITLTPLSTEEAQSQIIYKWF